MANRQLALGTISFAICFAAWGLISAFATRFREIYNLSVSQTAFLIAAPVLSGRRRKEVSGWQHSLGQAQSKVRDTALNSSVWRGEPRHALKGPVFLRSAA